MARREAPPRWLASRIPKVCVFRRAIPSSSRRADGSSRRIEGNHASRARARRDVSAWLSALSLMRVTAKARTISSAARGTFPKRAVLLLALLQIRALRPFSATWMRGSGGSVTRKGVSRQGVIMFGLFRRRTTIIAEGLKIVATSRPRAWSRSTAISRGICIAPLSSSRPRPRSWAGLRPTASS